jgi:hypothetical protein
LCAASLILGSASLVLAERSGWWAFAAVGITLSQILIVTSWTDAKYGTVVNIVLVLPVLSGLMNALPSSYINRYEADVRQRLSVSMDTSLLTEADIQPLPGQVQRYLRYTGSVGKPKVANFCAAMTGSMRRTQESGWMEIEARQYNFFYGVGCQAALPLHTGHQKNDRRRPGYR